MLTWVETSLLRIKMDQPPVELVELTKNVSSTAETINIYDMVTISLIGADSSDFQGENSDLVEPLCLCSCFCVFPPRKQQPARLWALHHTFPNTVRQLRTHAHTLKCICTLTTSTTLLGRFVNRQGHTTGRLMVSECDEHFSCCSDGRLQSPFTLNWLWGFVLEEYFYFSYFS